MSRIPHARIALVAALAAASTGAAGAAFAATGDAPTQVSVDAAKPLATGDVAPFDVPGVKAIRAGKPIPDGYELVGREVTLTKGHYSAGAALMFTCPGSTRLRSFAITGKAGFLAPTPYGGRKSTTVISQYGGRDDAGTVTGAVYAICR